MAQPLTKNLHNRRVGAWGENLAADHLLAHGYELVARNVRTEAGEIDLIARKDGLLVFVEVKTRRNDRFGAPEEAITPVKQQRMADAAELWLAAHPDETGDWQLDVIAIRVRPGNQSPEILHLEGDLG